MKLFKPVGQSSHARARTGIQTPVLTPPGCQLGALAIGSPGARRSSHWHFGAYSYNTIVHRTIRASELVADLWKLFTARTVSRRAAPYGAAQQSAAPRRAVQKAQHRATQSRTVTNSAKQCQTVPNSAKQCRTMRAVRAVKTNWPKNLPQKFRRAYGAAH